MKLRLGLLVVLLAALPALPAFATDDFPQRPLRIIVPFPAGAGPDNVARLVGQHLQDAFGQTVLAKAAEVCGIEWDSSAAHSARYDAERTADIFCEVCNALDGTWRQAEARAQVLRESRPAEEPAGDASST